jgi:hypothetical protein
MKNIERHLGIVLPEEPKYYKDVIRIQEKVPILKGINPQKVHDMWESFSDDRDAQWIFTHDENIEEFEEWLFAEEL